MKKLTTLLFFILSLSANLAAARELTLNLDIAQGDLANLRTFIHEAQTSTGVERIVSEFSDSRNPEYVKIADGSIGDKIYNRNYPNGDFYYLIAGLDDTWSASDFAKFYSVAQWLSLRGFRTILNVKSYVSDLEEALSNPRTTAIVWNSHGAKSGTISDSDKAPIEADTFTKYRQKNLRYVLFANCYGLASGIKYGLRGLKPLTVEGWDRTVTSDDLFRYLFSDKFNANLEKALGKKLLIKPKKKYTTV